MVQPLSIAHVYDSAQNDLLNYDIIDKVLKYDDNMIVNEYFTFHEVYENDQNPLKIPIIEYSITTKSNKPQKKKKKRKTSNLSCVTLTITNFFNNPVDNWYSTESRVEELKNN